jgi:hypothetical protein
LMSMLVPILLKSLLDIVMMVPINSVVREIKIFPLGFMPLMRKTS